MAAVMAGEAHETYVFVIFYCDEQFEFYLPSDSTVEDVKLQIYEKTKVRPSKQNITGWTNDPINEYQLLSSFLPLRQNILWVLSTDNGNAFIENNYSTVGYPQLTNMLLDQISREETEEITDVQACISFIAGFISGYGDNHVEFHDCSLETAIIEACFTSVQSRKIIALYFHNDDDPFSKMLCPHFINGEIRNILEESYYVMGWDVSEEMFHSALKNSLNKNIDFEPAKIMITEKKAALLFLYPIENSITVFSVLHGKEVDTKDVLTALQAIQKNFTVEIENEIELENIKEKNQTQNDIGSKEFQQLMYDRLGDRDYDCFEYNEHEHLKSKIGFAKFGPPQSEEGYYEKQNKSIEETYKQICTYNNKYSEWKDQVFVSFIYNCLEPMPEEKIARAKKYPDYNPNTDMSPVPVYVIRKCIGSDNPCRVFIDSDNRMYNSWEDYIEDNKLHKCTMVLPRTGRYIGKENEEVLLERHLSPSCGIGHSILMGTDIATTVAGLASGGVFIAAMIPAIAVAPVALTAAAVTGIGVGVYSVIRSAVNIYDRQKHGESLSFANSEARGAYINIVAGTLGFVGAGATTAVSQLAARGINLGQGARVAVNAIGVLNVSASGVGIANSTYQVIDDWITEQRTPSILTVVQLSSSILFFGNAVYNFRLAGTIIEESQTDVLRRHQDSLRSNKHRRTFTKMMKETVRQNNGDVSTARAEVISTIRNMGNKDEVFAILTRNNKLFNKNGIRFSAENGEITLNGMSVDILEFGSMTGTERTQLLTDLPSRPQPSIRNTNNTTEIINTVITGMNYGQLIINGCTFAEIAATLLQGFSSGVQEKVIRICKILCDKLMESMDFPKISADYFSHISNEPFEVILRFVIDFLKIKVNSRETNYEQQKAAAALLPDFNEENFNREWGILPTSTNRAVVWFERIVNTFVMGISIDELLLRELIQYINNIIIERILDYCDGIERCRNREKNTTKNLYKISCKVCGGYYYSQTSS
ncbi:hypothetical protein ILUMI_10166 [Ignelater luminosus]|uniref:DUF4781 domain-containing protein n=1 Tax=Ignelater luminosus TaxID=2038154 RepID=A0A8K0CYM8_IGNLU|nr:hypothetical protein ILUMI_10166 [Ignelater luminosus]